jgi:hypothetical protein
LAYPIALLAALGSPLPQATEWQRIGDEIGAAFIFARTDFVKVRIIFHGRFLRSGKFFEQNSASSRNSKKLALC